MNSSSAQNIHQGSSLKIFHLNIEGISQAKSDYLCRILHEEDIDVVHIQETHAHSYSDLQKRGLIPGYTLVDSIYSNIYGLATYVKESLAPCSTVYKSAPNDLEVLVVAIDGILTANVYKPPLMQWPSVPFPVFLQPIVYCGDVNSHNEAWGY